MVVNKDGEWLAAYLPFILDTPLAKAGLAYLATGNNHYAESHEYTSKQSTPA